MTISRVENACKPLILQGLQKNIKKISTQGLTVLEIGAIVQLEQRERNKKEPNPQFEQLATLETTSRVLMAAAKSGS